MINISNLHGTYFGLILHFWDIVLYTHYIQMECTLLQLTQQLDDIFWPIQEAYQ